MSTKYWSNVTFHLQTALAAALTITGISKANPGVVTYTGTDPSNGDFVYLDVVGMTGVAKRVFRVANVNGAANTFELEGEDTSSYGTFTSGTAQVITFGVTLPEVRTVATSGGGFRYADDSVVTDDTARESPVLTEPMGLSFDYTHDPADAGYLEARKMFKTKTPRAIKVVFANGNIWLGVGKGGAAANLGGSQFQAVTTNIEFRMQGTPTEYAS